MLALMPYSPRKHYAPGDTPADRAAREEIRRAEFDRQRRLDPIRKFYMSGEWRRFAKAFLHRHPHCKACGAPATQVDHIKTTREHWSLRFVESNLQSLCQSCHSRKTAKESFIS